MKRLSAENVATAHGIEFCLVPNAAIAHVLRLQRAGDEGGVLWEMMDWDHPEHCFKRWRALLEQSHDH